MKISWYPVGAVFHMEQHIELGMNNCIFVFILHCTFVHPTINMILSQVLSIIKDLIIIIIIK